MSNPDEETAVNQFGKGDKYFGTAVVMITLPGLPMFGHGQIEGYSEKYGMEYKRSYYDEPVDEHLVYRHQAEIFPLMSKRYLFSQVNYFEFYDFIDDNGNVVENVFAYSNRAGGERALIIYNNSYSETRGSVKYPVSKSSPTPDIKIHSSLGEALGINPGWKFYYIYRDHRVHLEYLISGYDLMESGIYLYLAGYQYAAFIEFREVYDERGDYERLRIHLSGRGVQSIHGAMEELKLTPFHKNVKQLLSHYIMDNIKAYTSGLIKGFPDNVTVSLNSALESINHYDNIHFDNKEAFTGVISKIETLREVNKITREEGKKVKKPEWLKNIERFKTNDDLIFPFIILNEIRKQSDIKDLYKKTRMDNPLYDSIREDERRNQIPLLNIFTSEIIPAPGSGIKKESVTEVDIVSMILKNEKASSYLNINTWEGNTYYSKERFEDLIKWYFTITLLDGEDTKRKAVQVKKTRRVTVKPEDKIKKLTAKIKTGSSFMQRILQASDESGYRTEALMKILSPKKISKEGSVKTKRSVKKTAVKKKTDKRIKKVKDIIKKKKG